MKERKQPESITSMIHRGEKYYSRARKDVKKAERLVKEAFDILNRKKP